MKNFLNKIILGDCLEVMKQIPARSIDLVITDPPYLIKNTRAGGNSELSRSFQAMNDDIEDADIVSGVSLEFCDEILRLQDKVNAYIWCNKEQIVNYLDFFVVKNKCSFDILCWRKTNAAPLFCNKYLTDKEYCLYFRRGGYCQPTSYGAAVTIFDAPLNVKDKRLFGHPTIKPLEIIETLLLNSSKPGDVVLDCFSGSGTTGVACAKNDRQFVCIEKNEKFYKASLERLDAFLRQTSLF